ncbi:1759_t:CDS:2, partial [Racocetra fulgida]
ENDPYVLSSLDPPPYMHTHNTTRIIYNCANPEWNETFFHKIPQLDIVDERIKFKLSVTDWDRFTSDDLIGNAWIDIKNKIGDGTKRVKIHDGLQVTAAPYAKEAGIVLSDNVYDVTYPNPYCVVYLNDARVFRTRAKLNKYVLMNAAPYWNASTEQFVKDWKTAVVRIVVKDQKDLEYDPVIGMATIPLKGLLEHKGKEKNGIHYDMALDALQFGVLRRHRTGLVITLKQRGIFGVTHTVGTTTFWLKDMCDCKEFEVKLPIYAKKSENSLRLQDQTVKEQQSMSNLTNNEEVSRPQHKTFKDNQSNVAEGPSKEIISDELEIGEIIYDEPQELGISNELNNITPNELSQQGHCSSSTNDKNKQCKGYLKVKLYFRPGLSTAHEEDIKKSLTGVDASILELNPFQNIHIRRDDETETFDIEERSVPDNIGMYEIDD